jgi:hypothetical protein
MCESNSRFSGERVASECVSARMTGDGLVRVARCPLTRLGRGLPSTRTLGRFAKATGHRLKISFEPLKNAPRRAQ